MRVHNVIDTAALERIRQRAQQGTATDDNQEENDEEESSSDREVCELHTTDQTQPVLICHTYGHFVKVPNIVRYTLYGQLDLYKLSAGKNYHKFEMEYAMSLQQVSTCFLAKDLQFGT